MKCSGIYSKYIKTLVFLLPQELSASSSEDSRHVLFVDDIERRALKKLKVELKVCDNVKEMLDCWSYSF